MTMLLKVDKAVKEFGALRVCNEISFEIQAGEALGILGPNGAGKTTLLNLIAGDLPLTSGRILFNDQDVSGQPANKRCTMGIGRTSQIPRPFTGMTVYENVLLAAQYGRRKSEADSYHVCRDVLALTGLLPLWNTVAGNLRLLDRKRLELARALATQPSLLLLDEIAGGLTDHEVHDLLAILRQIRAQGVTIIWIEHIVHALVSVVDRIIAIDFGTLLIEGTPDEVIHSETFRQVYFGIDTDLEPVT
ncbi:MAG: ABC transporter ATP-binding protein [Pleurocapsa minor GSE-CHR-MK-17-07R]|jgi:branched-chain amino acid transport system ATP-binding protein|nr:ABC transporter ATP-binding protein [Pleurocapsa minor GSE-CHR-MK 17-07R]